MSLVLEELYQQVPHVGVSAAIGKGYDKLIPKFEQLKTEFFEVFLPELQGSHVAPTSQAPEAPEATAEQTESE